MKSNPFMSLFVGPAMLAAHELFAVANEPGVAKIQEQQAKDARQRKNAKPHMGAKQLRKAAARAEAIRIAKGEQ